MTHDLGTWHAMGLLILVLVGACSPTGTSESNSPDDTGSSGAIEGHGNSSNAFDPGKFDDPNCVAALGEFFARYGAVDDEIAEVWRTAQVAFGDRGNAIQMSWELEGTSLRVTDFYRPSHLSDAQWLALDDGYRFEEVAQSGWHDFQRLQTAPEFLPDQLKVEANQAVWELASPGHVGTLDTLFEHGRQVAEIDPQGGFHWHVTFLPEADLADEITAFAAQADEYVTLQLYAAHAANVHNSYLGIYSSDGLAALRAGLRTGADDVGYKWTSVAVRSRLYDDPRRIGLEVRAMDDSNLQAVRRTVGNIVMFLRDPHGHGIKLGTEGSAYRIADVIDVERVSGRALQRLAPETRAFIEQAARAAREGPRFEGVETADLLLDRWAIPMVQWEARPYLPQAVVDAVGAARQRFVERLTVFAERYAATGRVPGMEMQDVIERAVSEFARDTRLWEYW